MGITNLKFGNTLTRTLGTMGRQVYCLRSLGNHLRSKSLQKYGGGNIGFTLKCVKTGFKYNQKKYDVDR
jgi:hypothetical protein